jgi:hypothetical protein
VWIDFSVFCMHSGKVDKINTSPVETEKDVNVQTFPLSLYPKQYSITTTYIVFALQEV